MTHHNISNTIYLIILPHTSYIYDIRVIKTMIDGQLHKCYIYQFFFVVPTTDNQSSFFGYFKRMQIFYLILPFYRVEPDPATIIAYVARCLCHRAVFPSKIYTYNWLKNYYRPAFLRRYVMCKYCHTCLL